MPWSVLSVQVQDNMIFAPCSTSHEDDETVKSYGVVNVKCSCLLPGSVQHSHSIYPSSPKLNPESLFNLERCRAQGARLHLHDRRLVQRRSVGHAADSVQQPRADPAAPAAVGCLDFRLSSC